MRKLSRLVLLCALLGACNAETPTSLGTMNPALIRGRFSVSFSQATCQLQETQVTLTQFNEGGALPDTIRLLGSWQVVGQNANNDLVGRLIRDTGEIWIELITNVRTMEGIVLDNDNIALGYTDLTTPCRARAAMRRID